MNVATINYSFFQVHSHFFGIFNKIIKFKYFSRTGKTVVIFPGAVGTLLVSVVPRRMAAKKEHACDQVEHAPEEQTMLSLRCGNC